MMTNLLNGAHVANKLFSTIARLRFLLVMFLTLTVTTNAWADSTPGTGYTLVTDISSLSTNDKVILFCNQNGEGVSGYNGSKDANVSTTAANWIEYLVTKSTNSFTLKDGDKYIANPGGNEFKYGGSGGACTLGSDGLLICNSRNLMKNGNNYRFYATTQSYTNRFYVYKVAVSYAITAQSNNTTYGTVSLSGTTITATPKTGYRVSTTNPYTISPSNSAKVTQNGNTFTVTPSANTTITIYFEAIPKYTVTLNAGPGTCAASVTEASAGAGVTLPTPTLNGCGEWTFAGWKTTSAVTTETTTEPTLIPAGAYSPTSDITLYAVYQRTEDEGGNSTPTSVTKVFSGANNADLKFTTGSSSNHLVNNTGYTAGDANVKFTTGTNNNNSYYDGSVVRFYAGSSMIITPLNGVTITRVEIVRSSSTSSNSGTISADNLTASNSNSTTNTNVFTGSSTTAVTFINSAQCRFTALNVTYTTSGGGSSTTYYHSTPDCGSTEPSLCLIQKVVVH